MSPENEQHSPAGLNYDETKLTLGLPGSGSKRVFSETATTVDLNLGSSCSSSTTTVDDEVKTQKPPAK